MTTLFRDDLPKALIVGASGQVGTQMLGAMADGALEVIPLPTSRVERQGWLRLDLAELESEAQAGALLDEVALAAVYCVGGMTFVDGCEAEPEAARRTNARGPGVLAGYARRRSLPFVYFSSDYVFDGRDGLGPYAEEARPNPLSAYGSSKLEGEQRVMAAHEGALVVRTTWVYGADSRQKNYLYSLMRSLASGERMRTPMDQVSTPTYNRDTVEAAIGLVAAGASGVFHVAGPESMSRMEFAQRLSVGLGLDAGLLEGVTTAELGQAAARPLASGLKTDKLAAMYPEIRMRTLAESLEDCGAELRGFLERQR